MYPPKQGPRQLQDRQRDRPGLAGHGLYPLLGRRPGPACWADSVCASSGYGDCLMGRSRLCHSLFWNKYSKIRSSFENFILGNMTVWLKFYLDNCFMNYEICSTQVLIMHIKIQFTISWKMNGQVSLLACYSWWNKRKKKAVETWNILVGRAEQDWNILY